MSDTKTAAKAVAKIGRIRTRLTEQRRAWIARSSSQPEARRMVEEMDRELAINAEQLRLAKEALAAAKRAKQQAPPAK